MKFCKVSYFTPIADYVDFIFSKHQFPGKGWITVQYVITSDLYGMVIFFGSCVHSYVLIDRCNTMGHYSIPLEYILGISHISFVHCSDNNIFKL